jgi:hypothetical protein
MFVQMWQNLVQTRLNFHALNRGFKRTKRREKIFVCSWDTERGQKWDKETLVDAGLTLSCTDQSSDSVSNGEVHGLGLEWWLTILF